MQSFGYLMIPQSAGPQNKERHDDSISSFAGVWRSYLQNAGKGQNLEHAKDQYLTDKTNGFLRIFIGKPTH